MALGADPGPWRAAASFLICGMGTLIPLPQGRRERRTGPVLPRATASLPLLPSTPDP